MSFDTPMKPNNGSSNNKRPRGRGPLRSKNHSGGNRHSSRIVDPRTHTFDSNSPGGRVKGNAQQLIDKYTSLARDASATGDHVLSESYLQYADHYARLIKEYRDQQTPFMAPMEKMTMVSEVPPLQAQEFTPSQEEGGTTQPQDAAPEAPLPTAEEGGWIIKES